MTKKKSVLNKFNDFFLESQLWEGKKKTLNATQKRNDFFFPPPENNFLIK